MNERRHFGGVPVLPPLLRLCPQHPADCGLPLSSQHLLLILTLGRLWRSVAHFLHRSAFGEVLSHGMPQSAQAYCLSFV